MKLFDIKKLISERLAPHFEDARYESERVISYIYGLDKTKISLSLFDEFEYNKRIDDIVVRRICGEPFEYITEKAVFCGLDFKVSADCLIPQSDTEIVVTAAAKEKKQSFIDICTGSGCIAIALASLYGMHGAAVDIYQKAIDIAKKNAEQNNVSDKISFSCADVFDDGIINGERYDIVISNPPYIKSDVIKTLPKEVLCEPHIALDGGDDGLMFYRRIADIAPRILNPNGTLIFEIGYDEKDDVALILSERGFSYNVVKDYGGNYRCICAHLEER